MNLTARFRAISHASRNVGDTYGSNPLSRMADELKKFPSIAKAAGLLK